MIFSDIESYIEFMAGYRDISGKQVMFWPDPKLTLASYDVGFITSVSEQTISSGIAMSYKQAALSEKLIEKYAKQLRRLGVEQPNHKNYRLGNREVKHVTNLSIVDGMLHYKFPFNEKMIADIKSFCKESQGRVFWSKDDKSWVIAITEYNVNWIVAYLHHHKIPVDPKVQELYDLILEAEKTPYSIELRVNDAGQFYIANAPKSLNAYITEHIGFDNIYSLVDMSGVLGYTISKDLAEIIKKCHGESFMKLCAEKNIDFVPKKDQDNSLSKILEWAITVNRLPICVYNPNFLTPDLEIYEKYFKKEEIQILGMKEDIKDAITVDSNTKIVYTNKILPEWEGRMPLLITYANLMHGPSKLNFLSKAEKVVYHCETLPKR